MSDYHYIYVISDNELGPVKLGVSADPDRRLKQLQTGHPGHLRVHHREAVEPENAKVYERLLHMNMNHRRRRGEWFNMSVSEAMLHVQFTLIHYGNVEELPQKFRDRRL